VDEVEKSFLTLILELFLNFHSGRTIVQVLDETLDNFEHIFSSSFYLQFFLNHSQSYNIDINT